MYRFHKSGLRTKVGKSAFAVVMYVRCQRLTFAGTIHFDALHFGYTLYRCYYTSDYKVNLHFRLSVCATKLTQLQLIQRSQPDVKLRSCYH